MRVAMVIGLIAIALFGLGLPALALDGPTPPELGDPTAGRTSPHGGYSSGTDFCLQCHSVHAAPDPAYALMARSSTTGVCATCHGYLGTAPTGAIDPGFDPQIEGTASQRAVYTSNPVHVIGANGPTIYASNWDFGWGFGGPSGPSTTSPPPAGTASATSGGLYCASCHTPHGEFGQLINSRWAYTSADQTGGTAEVDPAVMPWQNDTRIWWDPPNDATPNNYEQRYLWQAAAGDPWEVCTGTGGSGVCDWAQVRDTEDQLVSLYGYKLLSSSPNHQYPFAAAGTPPAGALFSNAGATMGDLVTGISATDLAITVNETTHDPSITSRPSTSRGPAFYRIGSELVQISGYSAGTFPDPAAVYNIAMRGVNGTTPAAHAAGDDVLTIGTQRATVRSWDTDIYNHDGALFCGTCHSSRIDWEQGGTSHNHPTGCEACHGNPSDGSSSDFPHSSTSSALLQTDPDALCINCHTPGSLP